MAGLSFGERERERRKEKCHTNTGWMKKKSRKIWSRNSTVKNGNGILFFPGEISWDSVLLPYCISWILFLLFFLITLSWSRRVLELCQLGRGGDILVICPSQQHPTCFSAAIRLLSSNNSLCSVLQPNQQRTLNKPLTELRCRNFVDKHRLSMQIGAQMCKNVYAMSYVFRLSFCFACHRWWLGTSTHVRKPGGGGDQH